MSRMDRSGIVHNSFYETDDDLKIEPRTEGEMIEYKRLIGMPIADDYDEIIESLKGKTSPNCKVLRKSSFQ